MCQVTPLSDLSQSAVPATRYSSDELAMIYNQARVDYIVPMPMNGKRMAEYIRYYDIDLAASRVILNQDQVESGIGMLGLREDRAWITRLGIIPERRGYHSGQFLTERLLEESARNHAKQVQLEVITGNTPAYNMFKKFGFETVRELVIVRRPPGTPTAFSTLGTAKIRDIPEPEIALYLAQRQERCSWLDENPSLLNAGSLRGVLVTMPDGASGWVIYQRLPFQLTHFAFSTHITEEILRIAMYHIHSEYASQDTKIENIDVTHPNLEVLKTLGYFEVFRRYEMILRL